MEGKRYLTAGEAAEALGVSLPTLYAYVSRGLLRSQPAGGSRRSHQYPAEDVQRLIQRHEYRRDPSKAASGSMHWGTPILETELTNITESELYYRGQNAVDLALTRSIEDVAALLWTGDMGNSADLFSSQSEPMGEATSVLDRDFPMLQRVQVALTLAAAQDISAYDLDLQGKNTLRTGARILRLIASVLAGGTDPGTPIARKLRDTWCPGEAEAERLLDAALILCADHELSASSFTARVVASAEANLYLVVTAAMAALQGFKHGGNTELVEVLLREVSEPAAARRVIAARLRRGDMLPGFGHRLYPSGDPRAAALRALIEETHANSPERLLTQSVIEAVDEVTGKRPTIDFALVALARTLHLPTDSALALFVLGRTVGWIGHAIEQYRSGQLIRPRATYVGPC